MDIAQSPCDVCTESLYVLKQNARRSYGSRRVSADLKWISHGVLGHLTDALVIVGLRLACDDRTMPTFAFSCGLRRVTLRCPYDSTTFYDLRSIYDLLIVCTITNFKNRNTVARRHVVRHHTGAVRRPCDDRTVTLRFLYDSLGTKICTEIVGSPHT